MPRRALFPRFALTASALWFGMQIMAGYIAAPVLFKLLPKMQAGEIAGILFGILSWTGLAIWAFAFFAARRARPSAAKWIAALWLLIAANQFLVTPVIEALKYGTSNWLLSLTGGTFGAWHGISSLIFMICAILAAVSVWKMSDMAN